jgi:membrane fusion protein (multidrug efflux system)
LIKHGASGKVQMTNTMEDVYLIPQKSTFEIQDYNYVYMLDENNIVNVRSFRPIKRYGLFYLVEGFDGGDRVVLEGLQLLQDGSHVDPKVEDTDEVYRSLNLSL